MAGFEPAPSVWTDDVPVATSALRGAKARCTTIEGI